MVYAPVPALTPGVSAQVMALACREMSALLKAGMSLDHALASAAPTGPFHFRRALAGLSKHVSSGLPLSDGLRAYSSLFHPVVPAIVRAGEVTGNLDSSFALLTEFFEFEAHLKRTVQNALIYPSIVVVVAILVVCILSYIGFMPSTWAVRLLWAVGILAVMWLAMRFRIVQRITRHLAMLLPFIGGIMQELAVARFCMAFGLLTRAGVPYLEGLETTQPVIQHPLVERAAQFIYAGVRNGSPVEQCIRVQPAFPSVVHNLVGAGEAAGSLDEMLLKAAEYLRQHAEYKIRNAALFIGPTLIVVMGIIVLIILISFWGNYFDKILSILDE